ncbi:MAG: hypothetical protein LRZ84_00115 [Desertifilum sp.]|nr:hypothetical protein [Desertifilum sp.]
MIDNSTDINCLRAFIGTLAELESLNKPEQEQLSKIGQDLKENLKSSIDKLDRFALANESRKSLYEEAIGEFFEQYEQRCRTKVIKMTISNSSVDPNHKEVKNYSLSTDALGSLEILQIILEANSVERAKQVKEQVIQANQLQVQNQPWWHWLGYLFGS